VKEMRVADIRTIEQANCYLEITFWPIWNQRFTVEPQQGSDAHRSLQRAQRLEQILSVRVARTVASEHTVGRAAQTSLCRIARRSRRDRAAARWHALAALSRPLLAAEFLLGRAAIGKRSHPARILSG